MTQPDDAVVVAVGADAPEAALTFAVDMARRIQRPLHLVHVLPVPADVAYSGMYGGAIEVANSALAQSTRMVQGLDGDEVSVTTERVDDGGVAAELIRRANNARMVVLQHRRLPKLRRLVVGSTVNAVASKALVPVVAVPESWHNDTERAPVVTAAVQDPQEAEPLLRLAFEQARILGASAVVLHSWWLASGYDLAVVDQAARDEAEARTRAEMAPIMDALSADFPDVEARLDVRHAPPAEALLDAAEVSRVLVIGRRHHLLRFGTHLGPVARAALDRSACPVVMVPEGSAPR